MEDLFKEHFGTLIATLITGFGGWFFGRRKSNAEASIVEADYESKEIDNGGKIVSMYKEAIDDLGNRYEKKYQEVAAIYDKKIEILEAEIKLQKQIISGLKKENSELKQRIKELESNSTT